MFSNTHDNSPNNAALKRQVKSISSACVPSPYRNVPKRRNKIDQGAFQVAGPVMTNKRTRRKKKAIPRPFFPDFSDCSSSSLLSSLLSLFDSSNKRQSSPVGFMPLSPKVQVSPLSVAVPATTTAALAWSDQESCDSILCAMQDGACSHAPVDTHPGDLLSAWSVEDDTLVASSTMVLSDILCDHYAMERSVPQPEDACWISVPLETFRLFAAPHDDTIESDTCRQSMYDDDNTRHGWSWQEWLQPESWTLVEQKQEDSLMTPLLPDRVSPFFRHSQRRHVRANPAHLRMLVAEINMMRANKIVEPLKPRAQLSRRADRFAAARPSRLRIHLEDLV